MMQRYKNLNFADKFIKEHNVNLRRLTHFVHTVIKFPDIGRVLGLLYCVKLSYIADVSGSPTVSTFTVFNTRTTKNIFPRVLCYKPEGRGFDFPMRSWDFPFDLSFRIMVLGSS
jgi:hypothetical protein